jgi:spore cortex formation protein SpoVR/YcgB (stage V sporulation)
MSSEFIDIARTREQDHRKKIIQVNQIEKEMCLVDSCITNSILRKIKYFQTITRRTRNILIIAGHDTNIVDSV